MPKFLTNKRFLLATGVLFFGAALTACRDTTAPPPVEQHMSGYLTTSAAVLKTGTINFTTMFPNLVSEVPTVSTKGDTTIQSFTVNPKFGRLIMFGGMNGSNVLAIPAGTICDPNKSGYGPSEWLKPCQVGVTWTRIEIRSWKDKAGRPHAEFFPAIRFNPAAPVPVSLYFRDAALVNFSTVYIPYCNAQNVCVNEETKDSFMTTKATPALGGGYWVYRNLRHFSGYNVTAF